MTTILEVKVSVVKITLMFSASHREMAKPCLTKAIILFIDRY